MGHEGKILVKKEDKRAEPSSSHRACNLFGGETVTTTGNKGTDQTSNSVELAITDSYLVQQLYEHSVEDILERLRDDKIYSIGIVGLGGSGKTTLAKEVAKKADKLNLFYPVVWINVPQVSDLKRIQWKIANFLGLRLETEDLRARARQIFESFRSEERILIILDDVWERLDLQQIGIPSSENPMGCKLILITRNMQVVKMMECQFVFHQYLLTEEAVWPLFCKWAGIENVSLDPNILDLSKKLVQKCRGSPLAASLAGGCLRGIHVDEWVVAINIILQDLTRIKDYNYNPFFLLVKWIYEVGLVSGKVAKSLLLISGLFPKGKILIEHLSHYAITLGLCAKNEVNAALNSLIYCSVLIHYDESKDYVLMHEIVRSGARWILVKENPAYSSDSIGEYPRALSDWEDFCWKEKLDELVHQIFHVRDDSSSSIVAFSSHVYTHPEPSGKLVDFKGMCQVDESYLPFLKEVCKRYPQLIKCQAIHSKTLKQAAFNSLGQLLFMLNNAAIQDWVYLKDELKIYWDQALLMQFDLEWLKPHVETVLSSTEIHRIEAFRKELEKRNAETEKLREQLIDIEAKAEKVRQQLNHVEAEATHYKNEIGQLESKFKFNGSVITHVSKSRYIVFKVNPWQKIFGKRK